MSNDRRPERARVFLSAEPAIIKEETRYVDDGKGGKKLEPRTVTVREADIALVIQVTESGRPDREWLSTTKRLSDAERKQLEALFDKLVASGVADYSAS